MQTLVSSPEGAIIFTSIDDITPLTEIAPRHPEALQVLSLAWLNSMDLPESKPLLRSKIDATVQQLVSSFKGTDAVTLLTFLGTFLRSADPEVRSMEQRQIQLAYMFTDLTADTEMAGISRWFYTGSGCKPSNGRVPKRIHHAGGGSLTGLPG